MGIPFKEQSLFFAPMEGVTDETYRMVINRLYPEWDYISTDFLRLPTVGQYPDKHMMKHFGEDTFNTPELKNKTLYQILTSENALTQYHIERINNLGFDWLDINLGCPSKTVCKNKGGSYLLSDLPVLRSIIKEIREIFKGTFTAKIRVGYKDDSDFINILRLLEEEGVDSITIHARTREELYKGVANWDYVKKAVEAVKLPIVGNGDIWTAEDIDRYFDYTKAHSVMIARGALKTPWLARDWKDGIKEENLENRLRDLKKYFHYFYDLIKDDECMPLLSKTRRLKSVSRYIFDPLDPDESKHFKRAFLLSKTPEEMFESLEKITL